MAKPKLTVVLPDGSAASRTTDRAYTHAIVARVTESDRPEYLPAEVSWIVLGWTTQRDAALNREARKAKRILSVARLTGLTGQGYVTVVLADFRALEVA
jgi:hypothetical protein